MTKRRKVAPKIDEAPSESLSQAEPAGIPDDALPKPAPQDEAAEIKVKAAEPVPELYPADVSKWPKLRCIWDSRLIIGADRTPSGARYDFAVGQVQPVNPLDYEFLKNMELQNVIDPRSVHCCGTAGQQAQKYFSEV